MAFRRVKSFVFIAAGAAVVLLAAVARSRSTPTNSAPVVAYAPQPLLETLQPPPSFPAATAPWTGPGYVRGDANAPVTVLEFSDFGCPYCGQFAIMTYPALHEQFVKTGKVRWIYVPFVMGMFPNGEEAAMAGECAAEAGAAAFWKMHDKLYETQPLWKAARQPRDHFRALAAESGVARADFDACYSAKRPAARIQASNQLSRDYRVRATPTFFVQGERVEGALPLPVFRQLLTEAVETARRAAP